MKLIYPFNCAILKKEKENSCLYLAQHFKTSNTLIMKKISHLSKLILGITTSLLISSFTLSNQCDPEELLKKHASSLDEYVFIKSFPIETSKSDDVAQYSYVLSRGINYRIVVCDEDVAGKKMTVSLYDRNKKLIATNYLKSKKKFFGTINYVCSATGVYYIEASFEGQKNGCGLNILGFKK